MSGQTLRTTRRNSVYHPTPREELDEAVREIGQPATGIEGVISRLGDVDKSYQIIREQKGKLDILFASGGVGEFGRRSDAGLSHTSWHILSTIDCLVALLCNWVWPGREARISGRRSWRRRPARSLLTG
jgi:hypothetical protein